MLAVLEAMRGRFARARSAAVIPPSVSGPVAGDKHQTAPPRPRPVSGGSGFDPAAVGREHFGLRSMRGRVADLGGSLEVTSALGRGTILHVEVPARPGE